MTAVLPPPPAELAQFSAHLSPEGVLRLIESFGGTVIYVPQVPNQGSPLTLALGRDEARALAAALGGERVKVPLAKYWRIQLYKAQGLSYAEIARKLGTTEGVVWRHLRDAGLTRAQPSLFDP